MRDNVSEQYLAKIGFLRGDYANNVDLQLAGWRVIRIWECEIKTMVKRNITLEALYLDIVSTTTEYNQQNANTNIAAEPNASYDNQIQV